VRSLVPFVAVIVCARRPRDGAALSQSWAIAPDGRRRSWCPMDDMCAPCQRHEEYVFGRRPNPKKGCSLAPSARKRARSDVV
jgi:hypothetical protein